MVAAMAGDLALARSEVGFGMGYAHPEQLPDDLLASYLAAVRRRSGQGTRAPAHGVVGSGADGGRAAAGRVARSGQVAWGTGDAFFEPAVGRAAREP